MPDGGSGLTNAQRRHPEPRPQQASGLIFIAATTDNMIRAYDIETNRLDAALFASTESRPAHTAV